MAAIARIDAGWDVRVDAAPPLARDVRVALVVLEEWRPWQAHLTAWLSDEERVRIARKRRAQDRDELASCYGLHRLFLAQLHGIEPPAVPLGRDEEGRPCLNGLAGATSLSHAPGVAAFAFAREGAVGVDVEACARVAVMDEIAGQVAHPEEQVMLARLPAVARQQGLLELWVRKEAFLKAVGIGLACEMSGFRMAEELDSRVAGDRDVGRLRTATLALHPAYALAVSAAQGQRVRGAWWRPQ